MKALQKARCLEEPNFVFNCAKFCVTIGLSYIGKLPEQLARCVKSHIPVYHTPISTRWWVIFDIKCHTNTS